MNELELATQHIKNQVEAIQWKVRQLMKVLEDKIEIMMQHSHDEK